MSSKPYPMWKFIPDSNVFIYFRNMSSCKNIKQCGVQEEMIVPYCLILH